ncbi:histidine kinase [Knoellia sp. CPCC 206450]|uniref:histidine kinase n=1 Tax=Knoellia tibetensis TaxID=3404798 RepID=UPI003B42F366
MELTPFVDSLQRELAVAAAAGGPEAESLAERLTAALESAVRLTLQEAVVDAAAEITVALAPGSVDVRLAGRGLAFVVTPPATEAPTVTPPVTSPVPTPGEEEGGTSRITFRPSDRLKADIEAAAEREGLSVNAFLVRMLTLAVRSSVSEAGARHLGASPVATPRGGQRLSGWVR